MERMLRTNDVNLDRLSLVATEELAPAFPTSTGSTIANTLFGAFAGGLLGAAVGWLLLSGSVGGAEMFATFGLLLPILLGVCLAGAGLVVGSFIDLSAIVQRGRR